MSRAFLCLFRVLSPALCASFLGATQLFAVAETARQSNTNVVPINLTAALRLAGAQNLDIKIAREKLAEAKANHETALMQLFPWLSPGIGYRRHQNFIQDVSGNILNVDKESYTAGGTLMAQLDLGDSIYRTLAARQLVKAADYALESQRQDAVLDAAQNYFELAKAQAAIAIAGDSLRIFGEYDAQLTNAVAAGVAFRGDALRVQVQADHARLLLRQAQEQRDVAATRLAQILRLDPATKLVPEETELTPISMMDEKVALDPLVVEALQHRSELKESQALVAASGEAKKGATYGPLIPSLGAQAFIGGLGGGRDGGHSSFGESEDYAVSLSWRIGPGGLFDRGRIHAAEARVRGTKLAEEKLRDDIMRQVVESLTRVQSLTGQIAEAQKALKAAQETFRLTKERKEFAVGIVLENIQAEQDLTRARTDYLNAVAEFNKAQFQLKRAVGGNPDDASKR